MHYFRMGVYFVVRRAIPFALLYRQRCKRCMLQFELLFQYGRTISRSFDEFSIIIYFVNIYLNLFVSVYPIVYFYQLHYNLLSVHEGLNQTCSERNPIELQQQQQQQSAYGEICIGIGVGFVCGSMSGKHTTLDFTMNIRHGFKIVTLVRIIVLKSIK